MFIQKLKIYPKKLENHIRFNTKYIPRQIKDNEELDIYHRYWIDELSAIFKLVKIEEFFRIQYYFLEGKNTSQVYTYPVHKDKFYELEINESDILSQHIINDNIVHKGYYIRYWFYKNWNKKYKDFEKYLVYDSPNKINDNDEYYVESVIIKGNYRNCKIIAPRD